MTIYKITNTENDKVYIGQTTRSLDERIRGYRNDVRFSKSKRPIVKAMREIGIEKFTFTPIYETESKRDLDDKEKEYIEKYDSTNPDRGYNIELGGNSVGKHAESTKKKISEAQLGFKNHMYCKTGYDSHSSKEVIDLSTLKTYGSASIAAEELNLEFSHVCSVARGERGSTGNRVFRYVDDDGYIVWPKKCAKIKSAKSKANILQCFDDYIDND